MKAKKSFGQNFLTDKNIVRKIVVAAEVKPNDLILEIGPGKGILTEALLEAGARVIAVELDEDLIEPLQMILPPSYTTSAFVYGGGQGWGLTPSATVKSDRWLIHGDILSTKVWEQIKKIVGKQKYSVVANIPYNITSPILETLFRAIPKPERLTLMVQKEVAERILAKPPKTSVLSIACQLYAEGKKVLSVSRGSFVPAPKVDSTVIRLDLYKTLPSLACPPKPERRGREDREGCVDPEAVLKIVKVGFSARRKQLHGNLSKAGFGSSEQVKNVLKKIDLNEKVRAENLFPKDWIDLFKAFE